VSGKYRETELDRFQSVPVHHTSDVTNRNIGLGIEYFEILCQFNESSLITQ